MHSLRKIQLILWLFFFTTITYSQAPEGYYNAANGKAGAALKTAIYTIIRPHTKLDYYSSSEYFKYTDWNPNGYFWDMYSNYKRTDWYGMNREHSLPKSWFGVASGQENSIPMGTDLHNLYPSDYDANMAKSNYPLGVVTGTNVITNAMINEKVGLSTSYSPQYTGTVFEPADEYKGDFARDYMYMVTCYEDYSSRWTSIGTESMLLGGTYPVFRDKAIALLLKWHRQDPVSTKEIDRNNAVFKLQGNRNPFVDYPDFAEFIWGKYVGKAWKTIAFTTYPSPARTLLKVMVKNPTLTAYNIHNLSGILVQSGKLSADTTLSVEQLKNGLYILTVYSGSTRMTDKLEVRH
ncbi:MAG: endonuclease [Paludibacter sp.]